MTTAAAARAGARHARAAQAHREWVNSRKALWDPFAPPVSAEASRWAASTELAAGLFPRPREDDDAWSLASASAAFPPVALSPSERLMESAVCARHDGTGEECGICLASYKPDEHIMWLPCRHGFHEGCLRTWIARQASCPACRWDGHARISPQIMKQRQAAFKRDAALVREQISRLEASRPPSGRPRSSSTSCTCVVM
eukprot:3496360-Prymnesium_polylepis.1